MLLVFLLAKLLPAAISQFLSSNLAYDLLSVRIGTIALTVRSCHTALFCSFTISNFFLNFLLCGIPDWHLKTLNFASWYPKQTIYNTDVLILQ